MSTATPLVSIIIPTYNRAYLIGETLDSVRAQTYQNWECIVVDDGSTDHTAQVMAGYMEKDARFQYHNRPADRLPGGNAARNYGFELSKGEYIQWFDSDDIMLPEYLEKKIAAFTPQAIITICTGYSVNEDLSDWKLKKMPKINNLFKQYVLWQSKIMSPSIIFRRIFLENNALFNEELLRGQENELFSRLFFPLQSQDFVQLKGGLYLYRQHPATKSVVDKTTYNSSFRKSLGLVSIYNLQRGIEIGDFEVANYHYNRSIHSLFNALYEKDTKLAYFFLQQLSNILKKHFRALTIKLNFWVPVFIKMGRTIYGVEKRLKNYKLK